MRGGVAANRIAQWNGTNWSPLGSGLNSGMHIGGSVAAMAVWGGNLYAGRRFSSRRATSPPCTSRNGMGPIGRCWGLQWISMALCGPWRCWAATCMRAAISRRRVASQSITLRVGTDIVGGRSTRGFQAQAVIPGALMCTRAGRVGEHLVCGRGFQDGWQYHCQFHRAVGWNQLVGARLRNKTVQCRRWRCRAARLYAGGYFTKRGAVSRLTALHNGNGTNWLALGPGLNRATALAASGGIFVRRHLFSGCQAALGTTVLRNGTEAIGRCWVRA